MKIKTFKTKVAGGIIALLLVGITVPTSPAQAATMADLQAQINSLLSQIATLQSKLPANASPVAVCATAKNDLTIGRSGTEVTELQKFLIAEGMSIPAGATGYFGGQTQQALVKFQQKHGISPAVGYYGPLTRAKVQSLCSVANTPKPTTPPVKDPTPKPDAEETLGGEASLERFSVSDGNDTDLEEGDTDAEVMEISFRVTDGDIKVNRIDVGFTPDSANNEQDPWDTFSKVSVWNGTKKLAEIDATREKNWKEDSPTNGDYLLRMSGVNWTIKENKDVELIVKVSVNKAIRGTADGEIWNIFVPNEGIRGLDADNAVVTIGDAADYVTLNIDEAGSTDELIVRRSNEDPDATTLQVKESGRSGFIKVFAFDIDTDDSKNDIDIRRLPVQLTVSTSTLNTFARDMRLSVDGKTYNKKTVTDGLTGTVAFEFEKGDFVIPAGDRVTVEVEVDFKALANSNSGTTIVGGVQSSNITAKGKDTLTGSQLASAATGEIHVLNSKGTEVKSNEFTAVVTSASGSLNDYVTFNGTVKMTAFGQDVYIPTDGSSVVYRLSDAAGNTITASTTAVVSSSARESGNYFMINEGSSETLTLNVTYVPGVANTTARLQLVSVSFSDSGQTPNQTWDAQPASSYRTPTKTIVD